MTEVVAHAGHHEHHGSVAVAATHDEPQHHPLRVYFVVWGWLFVLSFCSYMVDYLGLQGNLRWFLILAFMLLKAGLIMAIFMHMAWERLSLVYAIILPILAVLVFVGIMVSESDYTFLTRSDFFWADEWVPGPPVEH
jgi:cytochrome c oxidase subunit 4